MNALIQSPLLQTVSADLHALPFDELFSYATSFVTGTQDQSPHHLAVKDLIDTCGPDNIFFNDSPDITIGQYDPACVTWVSIDRYLGTRWAQGVLVLVCFFIPVFGIFMDYAVKFGQWADKVTYGNSTADMLRYNNFSDDVVPF